MRVELIGRHHFGDEAGARRLFAVDGVIRYSPEGIWFKARAEQAAEEQLKRSATSTSPFETRSSTAPQDEVAD